MDVSKVLADVIVVNIVLNVEDGCVFSDVMEDVICVSGDISVLTLKNSVVDVIGRVTVGVWWDSNVDKTVASVFVVSVFVVVSNEEDWSVAILIVLKVEISASLVGLFDVVIKDDVDVVLTIPGGDVGNCVVTAKLVLY